MSVPYFLVLLCYFRLRRTAMKLFSEAHIYRIYTQGVDATVSLIHRLVDKIEDLEAVSYTHLTLPTTPYV